MECWAARKAEAIGIVAEGFRPYVESLGVDPQGILRVRNWVHIEEPSLDRDAIRRHLNLPQDAWVCLHAGNMGFKQGLSNIVECARLAAIAEPRLLFVLIGDGSQRPLLESHARRYRLSNLWFLPVQPTELFSGMLAAADVLLINQRSSVTDMSLPSKLTSYFASGRPIVAAVSPNSEAGREIRIAGAGMVVPPDNPAQLLLAIREVASNDDLTHRLGTAGLQYARTVLSPAETFTQLENLLARLLWATRAALGRAIHQTGAQ
jgi:glycosyltransferase involved in cell wall biosynthesis